MNLLALPALSDNYIWVIHDGLQALVVDPGDAAPVKETLQLHGLTLTAILVTHHHHDHIDGLAALQTGNIPFYGPRHEAIAGVTLPMDNGDVFQWGDLHFRVWDTPGHTSGHIAYIAQNCKASPTWPLTAFVGDTLFSGGCGRIFDGTVEQLFDSVSRIGALPDGTRICPTHEYTLNNLRFAQAVEPSNTNLAAYKARCEALRAQHQPTLPTSIQLEKAINPFLRCTQPEVVSSALQHGARDSSPAAVFAALRQWKNTF